MKKVYVSLLSFASLSLINDAVAADAPAAQATSQSAASTFPPAHVAEIEKVVSNYLTKNPDIIMASFQNAVDKQQKEASAKMEQAVADNKDKIFKNAATPTGGNPEGTQTLVIFMDPNCGYCKKLHKELPAVASANKDLKIIFEDIPIMGSNSEIAIKAMLAAKEQGKYEQLQNAIYSAEKALTEKQILKIASSLGIDAKKLEQDMKDKAIQAQIDQTLELAKSLGVNGTPMLIVGETTVLPGYVSAEELNIKLKETASSADNKAANEKAS